MNGTLPLAARCTCEPGKPMMASPNSTAALTTEPARAPVSASHVIERPVRLHIFHNTVRPQLGQLVERSDLVNAFEIDPLRRPIQFASAEFLPIGKPGMSPNLHAKLSRQFQCRVGRFGIARMKTAPDIGGRNEGHELGVAGAAFAQVTVEIDTHGSHDSFSHAGEQYQVPLGRNTLTNVSLVVR